MLKNVLLIAIGLILGALITMVVESSLAIDYLKKLRKAEFEIKQLQYKHSQLFDENLELSEKVMELKQVLKNNGIPDYEDW